MVAWPIHRRRLKLKLFRRYEIGGQGYILVNHTINPDNGRYELQFMTYEAWEEELRMP